MDRSNNIDRRIIKAFKQNSIRKKISVLIIGGFPPPVVGPTVRIESLVTHQFFKNKVNYDLIDIIDRRSTDNMGKLEVINVYLGIKHVMYLLIKLFINKYDSVFLSIAQNRWAFIRDSIFIWMCWFFKLRIIVHLDGGHFIEFYKKEVFLMQKFIGETCKRISTAIVLGESLRYNFEGLVSNIKVVHSGIPIIGTSSLNKKKKLRVLYLSHLFRTKGFLDVLMAIPLIVNSFKNVEFIFVGQEGNGPDDDRKYDVEKERKKIISTLNINKYVQFLGPLYKKERDNQFKEADIFIFPTYYIYEGKPAVIMEAMSAGLPIITTCYPGSEELIINCVNGFFVEPQNPNDIAEKLLILLKNSKLRKYMGNQNIKKIQNEYDLDTQILRTIKILKNEV